MPIYTDEYIEKRTKWTQECRSFIYRADYKEAMTLARHGLKSFPNDTIASYTYYSILADYALSNNSKKFKDMHKDAVAEMKKLLTKTSGQGMSRLSKFSLKNEFYFQTKQFKMQYHLGKRYYDRHGEKRFLYSSGVGAAYVGLRLAKEGNKKLAEEWALKSVKAWELYFEYNKKYYNPYVHYAVAWGVLGNKTKMMKALKMASRLSGQPITYSEFQLTINSIDEISYLKD
jgi:hypothetical protein